MGFQFEQSKGWYCGIWAGIWKEKKQFAGKWDQDPPPLQDPRLRSKNNKWLNYEIWAAQKSFFQCNKMNKSASTGGFLLLMKLFIQVYENK